MESRRGISKSDLSKRIDPLTYGFEQVCWSAILTCKRRAQDVTRFILH
jgi:hypothetical protein